MIKIKGMCDVYYLFVSVGIESLAVKSLTKAKNESVEIALISNLTMNIMQKIIKKCQQEVGK